MRGFWMGVLLVVFLMLGRVAAKDFICPKPVDDQEKNKSECTASDFLDTSVMRPPSVRPEACSFSGSYAPVSRPAIARCT